MSLMNAFNKRYLKKESVTNRCWTEIELFSAEIRKNMGLVNEISVRNEELRGFIKNRLDQIERACYDFDDYINELNNRNTTEALGYEG